MDKLIILWHGVNEWEEFEGTLEEAISRVKGDKAYSDYGRRGATIIRGTALYKITSEGVES